MKKHSPQTGKPNRLINEKSPYLLQHAYNPVDWMPWGEEALARAREGNRLIFLSIGYSTCHWCHVMAHESFEDEEIASYLNRYFVAIKVDREERPDIDRIYMAATQALTGGGGWPMSVFLQPDRTPFYAGTYFPARESHGRPGFLDLLKGLQQAWQHDPGRIRQAAASLTAHLRSLAAAAAAGAVGETVPDRAFQQFSASYDKQFGGFGPAPKFPQPVVLQFLQRYAARTDNREGQAMTFETLRRMAEGGMYDLLGGGFHRYSVDGQWRVPHFEKMLYDQAQLATVYFEAYQLSREHFFRRIGTETLDYVLRDLADAAGGFFSAEDADSPDPDVPGRHGEGAFYIWREQEIRQILAPDDAAVFIFHYGLKAEGNALADPLGEFHGKNILYQARRLEETADQFGRSAHDIESRLAQARARLAARRGRRPRPHLDDKVICAWNGLMISALAKGYQVTGNAEYLHAARRSADFILSTLRDPQTGALLRRFRQGEAGLAAQLDDYAFLVQGLIDLYEAGFDINYLKTALALTDKQIELFADQNSGGFFETTDQDATLLIRMKNDHDGAEPAANSVAALNLLRLAPVAGKDWRERASRTMAAFAGQINRYPAAMPLMLAALLFYQAKPSRIIIAGRPAAPDTQALISAAHSRFLPATTLLLADGGPGQDFLGQRLPELSHLAPLNQACAYVCRDYSCSLPVTAGDELLKTI